jgi:Uma2 family endonuclease
MSPISTSDSTRSEWPDAILSEFLIPARLSEEEFVDWTMRHEKTRVEWVDGEVISMSPVSARHVAIFCWLDRILGIYVQELDLGEVFGSEFAVRLRTPQRISRRLPDLIFVRKDRLNLVLKNHLEGAPDLAIEIVSPDSSARDWTEKRDEYAAAGVREYWVIDPLAEKFEAFALNPHGQLISKHNQPAGLFVSEVVDGFQFQVEWLWRKELPAPLGVLKSLGVIS